MYERGRPPWFHKNGGISGQAEKARKEKRRCGFRLVHSTDEVSNDHGGKGLRLSELRGETTVFCTKNKQLVETKLNRISELSRSNPNFAYGFLIMHIGMDMLRDCFRRLDRKKAPGIDQQTKEEYGQSLDENLRRLMGRMKMMLYYPRPVKEVYIPKDNGGKRPLGISTLEDKIVQMAFARILEVIFEPIFLNHSYGFRRGRNCHQAIKALMDRLHKGNPKMVIDLDLENFFGTINHEKLIMLLERKIKDRRFVEYIRRMLKAGVLSEGEFRITEEGTPQGSIVSPILANIYAHYALDEWFEESIKPRSQGRVDMIRYADDIIIVCDREGDARGIRRAIEDRLKRCSLKINEAKTKLIVFNKWREDAVKGTGTFNFLGFTIYLSKSKWGSTIPKLKTWSIRYRAKLKRVNEWCKACRSQYRLREMWKKFCIKLRGHVQYYGVSYNYRQVRGFIGRAIGIFFKWLNRRGGKRRVGWEEFRSYMRVFPPPRAKIFHSLFVV